MRSQIIEKQKEVADAEAYKKVKREVMELLTKVAAEHRSLERHMQALSEKKQRMCKRKEAQERPGDLTLNIIKSS